MFFARKLFCLVMMLLPIHCKALNLDTNKHLMDNNGLADIIASEASRTIEKGIEIMNGGHAIIKDLFLTNEMNKKPVNTGFKINHNEFSYTHKNQIKWNLDVGISQSMLTLTIPL